MSQKEKDAEKKHEEDEVKLKEFVQDDRHFSLVRCVLPYPPCPLATPRPSSSRTDSALP